MTIPIVTQEDEVIGSKERDEIDFATDIFRTASLWITNSQGDVLLAQRKLNKKIDPGKWAEAVGGTVEGMDSYEETVIREAEEELGLTNIQIIAGPKQFIASPARYFVQWYVTVIDQEASAFAVQEEEVEKIAWIPRQQLLDELHHKPEKYIAAMPEIVALFPANA